MRTPQQCQGLPELADLVWAQRGVAGRLHYRLVVAGLVLASDRRTLVAPALTDVDETVAALEAAEHTRLQGAARVAADWGLPVDDLTLARIAAEAPAPWDTIFTEHHEALGDLATQIDAVVAENRRLAATALQSVRSTLGVVEQPTAQAYDASGRAAAGRVTSMRVDQVF